MTPDELFVSRTSLTDAGVRADQYRAALLHYTGVCRQMGMRLAFIETSGCHPADLLGDSERQSVEWFAFPSSALDVDLRAKGKGAIEAAALDAFVDSMDGAPNDVRMTKVTGRLIVPNLEALVRGFSNEKVSVRRTLDRRYCDTRLFSVTAQTWGRHLSGMQDEVDEPSGRFLEHVFAHRLIEAEYNGKIRVESFSQRPLFRGMSGEHGQTYNPSKRSGRMWVDRAIRPLLTRARDRQI